MKAGLCLPSMSSCQTSVDNTIKSGFLAKAMKLNIPPKKKTQLESLLSTSFCDFGLPITQQILLEKLADNSLILTTEMDLVYIGAKVAEILQELNDSQFLADSIPAEIYHICQLFVQSRSLFPNQSWRLQSEILTEDFAYLNIQIRWFQPEMLESPLLRLIVEEKHQPIQDIALKEAQIYQLSPREKEVWLLHRNNYTYEQIASKLFISPSTVKKHMASIHLKQKETVKTRKDYFVTSPQEAGEYIELKQVQASYADSVRAFIDLTLRPSSRAETTVENQQLYSWYKAFCDVHSFHAHSMTQFISRVKKILPRHRVKRQFKRINGQRITVQAHWKYLAPLEGVFEAGVDLYSDAVETHMAWNCVKANCCEGGLAQFLAFTPINLEI